MRLIDADNMSIFPYNLDYCDTGDLDKWIAQQTTVDAVPMDFHERCLQLEIQKRFAAEKAAPKWISVQDRLPEDDQDVLICVNGDTIDTGYCWYSPYHADVRGWTAYAAMRNNVTHWMPLPELPKEDEKQC